MKYSIIIAVGILLMNMKVSAQDYIPFSTDYWEIENANNEQQKIELAVIDGKNCLHLPVGHIAYLKDSTFENFIIEMDIAGVAMPGLGFRGKDKRNFEYVYLRVMSDDQKDALQYVPIFNGGFSWQLYNYPDYEQTASFPKRYLFSTNNINSDSLTSGGTHNHLRECFQKNDIDLSSSINIIQIDSSEWKILDYGNKNLFYLKRNGDSFDFYNGLAWIHIKLEVLGKKASLFVEDMSTPKIVIKDLKHENRSGYITLRNVFTDSYYANITINRIDVPINEEDKIIDISPQGYLGEWDISDKFRRDDLNIQRQIDSIKKHTDNWRTIISEPNGLINLSRFFDETMGSVLLKTFINSDEERDVQLLFDYAEHLVISLNSEIFYSNSIQMRDNEGCVIDGEEKINLSLKEGRNELIFVATADSYKQNWGFIARMKD